ncbi:hypothetical protein [Oceanihabitans sp. 2_MG-2023]|uniref:hypothetical protein n=1 Tax=Oceanihabitans sp. 2_MG-2023 TaxID=3062661 RepID=UPI0026E28D98|nr:hypothetical protein [Oceanihabitans sp. 2_MG-2023]
MYKSTNTAIKNNTIRGKLEKKVLLRLEVPRISSHLEASPSLGFCSCSVWCLGV